MNSLFISSLLLCLLPGAKEHGSEAASGIPGARAAVYMPSGSDEDDMARHDNAISLLEAHLVDYSTVEDKDFGTELKVGSACLEAENGQRFQTLIVTSADGISESAWSVIKEFSEFGGKLLFWGERPENLQDCPKAIYESVPEWTRTVCSAMPEPEIEIYDRIPAASLDYSRFIRDDEDLFMLKNIGDADLTFRAGFDAAGKVFLLGSDGSETLIPSTMQNDRAVAEISIGAGMELSLAVRRSEGTFNVRDFGACGDGISKDTEAIQNAADAAYADGGGTYLTGALFFRNGVNLEIQEEAVLVSTVDSDDFPQIPTRFEGTEKYWRCALLNFDNSRDVHVYGGGTILGRGQEWSKYKNKDGLWGRPRMICFTDCPGGLIEDLTMKDHASWCLHVLYTDGFTIDNLNISVSSYVPSSDGVDIDSSCNIKMTDVYTYVTDDCLSIKSGKNEDGRRVGRPSMNILVRNCNFDGGHGVAMGSEISGCIRNVLIEDCVCGPENRAPVRFKSQPSRGGVVENVTFKNMTLNGCGTFIDANLVWRMVEDYEPFFPRTVLRNIRVINVSGTARSVGTISGDPAAPIPEGTFIFDGCRIKADKGLMLSNVGQRNFDGLEVQLPEGEEFLNFRNDAVRGVSPENKTGR